MKWILVLLGSFLFFISGCSSVPIQKEDFAIDELRSPKNPCDSADYITNSGICFISMSQFFDPAEKESDFQKYLIAQRICEENIGGSLYAVKVKTTMKRLYCTKRLDRANLEFRIREKWYLTHVI